jgi:hypothetical protein
MSKIRLVFLGAGLKGIIICVSEPYNANGECVWPRVELPVMCVSYPWAAWLPSSEASELINGRVRPVENLVLRSVHWQFGAKIASLAARVRGGKGR